MLLLIGAYAIPLFFPPGPAPLIPPAPDAALLERIFPTVPGWWVVGRLLCLFVAGVIGATMVRVPVFRDIRRGVSTVWQVAPVYVFTAVAIAALHVVAGYWAADFNRALQLLYIVTFGVPALLLWAGEQAVRPASNPGVEGAAGRPSSRSMLAVVAVIAVWVAWRIPVTWRSLRGIDFVDVDLPFARLVEVVSGPLNLVSGNARQSSMHLVFQGAGLVPADVLLNWGWLQLVSVFWILASAAVVAYLGTRLIGRWAAPVATAAFLFSPFVLSIPLSIVPLFLGPIFSVALLATMLVVERERRPSAIAALGAVASLGALIPPITPMAAAVGGWAAWSLLMKAPRVSAVLLVIPVLSCLAAVVPSLPSLAHFPTLIADASSGRGQWSALEAMLFGQLSLAGGEFATSSDGAASFDLTMSAFLSPFATPRTAVRLWGDTVVDPIGAGLAAVGLLACLRRLRRDRAAAMMWVLLLVGVLAVVPSSYDRPSLARMNISVVVALWTAAGFEVIRRGVAARGSGAVVAAVATVAIALGGGVLFDHVNPGILARSALSVSLTALERTPASQGVIFARKEWDPQRSAMFVERVPAEPRAVLPYEGRATLEVLDGAATPAVMLWSPGLEDEASVSVAVCGRWPGAALYTLYDPPRLSRAFVASPLGPGWQPALPPSHWTVAGCEATLDTEGNRAAAALANAYALFADKRDAEAIAVLRQAARQSFVQAQLFEILARSILEHSPAQAELDEAIYWARRATVATKVADPRAYATLASAYGAQGRYAEAAAAAQRGEEVARLRQDEASALELQEKRRLYEREQSPAGR